MTPKAVLIIDEVHPHLIEGLQELGYTVDYQPQITRHEIIETIHNYTGLIVRSKTPLDRSIIDKASQLAFIGRYGAGMEGIDIEYASQKKIVCLNAPEGNCNAVGEHAVGLLLSVVNNICRANQEIHNGLWQRKGNWGMELEGKTVGIWGYGHTGSRFAEKLKGFNVVVLAYDKYKTGFSNDYVFESTPEEIFEQADIVSFHLPLTAETTRLVDASFLARFKKNIVLLNTSRGQIVDTPALVEAIESKKIVGTALDVLEAEKHSFEAIATNHPVFSKLLSLNNVILTPHIAGWTYEAYEKMAEVLLRKIAGIG